MELSALCRSFKHGLEAGLPLANAARWLRGKRTGRLGEHLSEGTRAGQSISETLDTFRPPLPSLFLAMTKVGEETGRLPETLAALERYYALQERMLRQIRSRLALVLIQFGAACLVLALVIGITGSLSASGGFTLFGLRGWPGAGLFLVL